MTGPSDARPSPTHFEIGADGLVFRCPRCDTVTTERLYGPCRPCRLQLASSVTGDSRQVEVARFEPPMHVTPNAVATRD